MKKFLWKTTGVGVTFGYLALFWYGTHGITWCWNLGKFSIWLTFVLSLIVFLGHLVDADKMKAEYQKYKDRHLPRWISVTTDIAGIAVLAAMGHPWYAGLWTFQAAVEGIIKSEK
jgi:hypothetical protein